MSIESEIKALIELRDQRRADDDKQGEQEVLEKIGQYAKNEHGWEILRRFYMENRLETRFEILTRQLIRGGQISRPNPFIEIAAICVRSGRLEEARLTLRQCISNFPNIQDYSWDLANLLISAEEYAEAERLVVEMLKQNPTDFACNVLLWRLLRQKSERGQIHPAILANRHLPYKRRQRGRAKRRPPAVPSRRASSSRSPPATSKPAPR